MLIVLSPSKNLNFDFDPPKKFSQPEFASEAADVATVLQKYSPADLQKLMKISPQLAQLNAQRYNEWHLPFTTENSRQALLAFKGEVYHGLEAETMTQQQLDFAQEHLRILSGLYGILRPLDLMQPYRLEMGIAVKVNRKKNLYEFWQKNVTAHIDKLLQSHDNPLLINLASDEYFKAIDTTALKAEIIQPQFKDMSKGEYKFITVYGKKARGAMTRFIIENEITEAEQIKLFDTDGYYYNDQLSKGNKWVFTRG
ncbi:MAG TPA: peroxide stress protein YaaA [Bacteroidales bacterium]|nr:peroxide stress protein YaaA [Bacteroidales bacterium]